MQDLSCCLLLHIMLIDAFFWAAMLTCQASWLAQTFGLLGLLINISWLVGAPSWAAGLACQAGVFTLLD